MIIEGRTTAKATIWVYTDTEGRKLGQRTGLETPVVHAVNDECSYLEIFRYQANALSTPPEKYNRKVETQRN